MDRKDSSLRKHALNGAKAMAIVMLVLIGLFAWETWTSGVAYAFEPANLLWWGKQGAIALVVFSVLTFVSWLSDRIGQRKRQD